ncbi:hypothetical protein [uncultured Desulfobacter sp.]|uniref:hypothetical protein n=1 Tax=uncultured Desulfobacter sp. TaxID=240139 RepID=UPI0029F5A378|nr:hypothetical protein [uncultured Desulfobacter sp.]
MPSLNLFKVNQLPEQESNLQLSYSLYDALPIELSIQMPFHRQNPCPEHPVFTALAEYCVPLARWHLPLLYSNGCASC